MSIALSRRMIGHVETRVLHLEVTGLVWVDPIWELRAVVCPLLGTIPKIIYI